MHKLGYQPGRSLVHKLHPITKLAWLLIGSVLILMLTQGFTLLFVTITFLIILHLINPIIWKVRGFKFAFLTGGSLFVLYLLFNKSGPILLDPGVDFLMITGDGLDSGLRFANRFLSIIFLSYIFIITTEPSQLAYALMKLGLPYRFGFMLVTALRLAPILEEEGQTIYRAQLVRGIRYDSGNLKKMILLIRQFLTPLLISALRRADKLVFSMEGRGFGIYSLRTFRTNNHPTYLDLIISLSLIAYFSVIIFFDSGGMI